MTVRDWCYQRTVTNGVLQRLTAYRHFARDLMHLGHESEALVEPPAGSSERLRVRFRCCPGDALHDLERTGDLTPYDLETIAEDARRACSGWSLDVHLDDADPALLEQVRRTFGTLGALGVRVHLIRHRRRRP